jgi:hypothetical protein
MKPAHLEKARALLRHMHRAVAAGVVPPSSEAGVALLYARAALIRHIGVEAGVLPEDERAVPEWAIPGIIADQEEP